MLITSGGGFLRSSGGGVPVKTGGFSYAPGDHGYFEALVARADFWKGYSLRPQVGAGSSSVHYADQLTAYAVAPSGPHYITYDPGSDPEPEAQDAAKIIIPSFTAVAAGNALVGTSVGASDTRIYFSGGSSLGSLFAYDTSWNGNAYLLIDDEIMRIAEYWDSGTNSILVERGTYGTTATTHAVGSIVKRSFNSLPNVLHLPLGTSDGHTYLFTWDIYYPALWNDPYLGPNGAWGAETCRKHVNEGFKECQFTRYNNSKWLEPSLTFYGAYGLGGPSFDKDVDLAGTSLHSYNLATTEYTWSATDGNRMHPTTTSDYPVRPLANGDTAFFKQAVSRWRRIWLRLEQNANDWDWVDMWIADSAQTPMLLYDHIGVSVPIGSGGTANSIVKFWLEFNTSRDGYCGYREDGVVYMRNFAALIDPPSDVSSLLVAPE